jgi:N-dimethylarginine dimethylaminohydrolase
VKETTGVEAGVDRRYGGQSLTDPLRRVLVRAPHPADLANWRAYGWLAEPDPVAAAREHEAFCDLLRDLGAEVELARHPVDGDPDAIYMCDPAVLCDRGVAVLNLGKEGRRAEAAALVLELEDLCVPVAFQVNGPATAEGGDTVWLDAETLLVGRGLRTNAPGIEALQAGLPGVEVMAFDLPYAKGPESCFHLMSLLSPLDRDLVVAYVPLMPVRLMELLAERSIRVVEVPDDEFESMGPNVLAVAARAAIAVDGNPVTRQRMEAAGVDVRVYEGEHISHRGEGGPTCLTRPLLRTAG